MSDPLAHEVVPQAIVKEVGPANLDSRSEKVYREVIKATDKGDWRKGLEKINQSHRVDYENVARLTANFGTEVVNGSVVRSQTEQQLISDIRAVEGVTKKFLEHGYDGLSGQEQIEMRRQVIEQFKKIPALAPQIDRLPPNQAEDFAMRYIKDPQFIAELSATLNEILSTEFENNAIAKFEDLESKKIDQSDKAAEFNEAETKLTLLQGRMRRYETDPATGQYLPSADKGLELVRLKNSRTARDGQITTTQQAIQTENEEIANLKELKSIMSADPNTAIQNINGQLTQLNGEIQNLTQQIANFPGNNNTVNAALRQPYQQELAQKTNEVNRLSNLKNNLQQQAALGRTPASIENDIGGKRTRIEQLQTNLNNFLAESQYLIELEQEEKELPQQVTNAETAKRQKEVEKKKSDEEVNKAQREYDAAKMIHEDAERKLKERFEHAFGNAAERMIAAQLDDANITFSKELEDIKLESKSKHESALAVTLQSTWMREAGYRFVAGRTEPVRELDKGQILDDYATLLREGDTALFRSMLSRTINPDTDTNFTDDEIDDIFDKNPDLVNKYKPETVKQLIARKALAGGFTPEDVYVLSTAPWGQNVVEQAMATNTNFRTELRRVGIDNIQGPGFWRKFRDAVAKHPFLMGLLLGIPALFKAAGGDPLTDPLLTTE